MNHKHDYGPVGPGPIILPFPRRHTTPPPARPYFAYQRTYDVGGTQVTHVSEWWNADTCPHADAVPMPHRDDVVMITRLLDPVSGRVFRPVASAPSAATR